MGEIKGPDFSRYIFKDIGLTPVLKGMRKNNVFSKAELNSVSCKSILGS